MEISDITKNDFETFWPIFKDIIQAQETYAFDPELDFESAYQLWCVLPLKCFVIKEDDTILGTYTNSIKLVV
jgi:hypothetical protein